MHNSHKYLSHFGFKWKKLAALPKWPLNIEFYVHTFNECGEYI